MRLRSSCPRSRGAVRLRWRGFARGVARRLALEWGVVPLVIPECADVEQLWSESLAAASAAGQIEPGDRVVITAGTHVNIPGSTNVIKVEVVT